MFTANRSRMGLAASLLAALVVSGGVPALGRSQETVAERPANGLVLVVMDPLSAPLACDCVQGYAQRKYEVLGEYLSATLHRPVQVVWGGAIDSAMRDSSGTADLVIGKHSVVRADAARLGLELAPVAALRGMDGLTTQTGLFVVRRENRAQSVRDLAGYRIFFGPADCDEKSRAPGELLRENGIEIPDPVETCKACSEAAALLMDLDDDENAAAIISSYAQPLLEGCKTIQKGDLRVIGETAPVPFITLFARQDLDPDLLAHLRKGLAAFADDPARCKSLETPGFEVFEAAQQTETAGREGTASGKK